MERPVWETNWQPISPEETASLFASYAGQWWISGGWAIDLFVGEPYRDHADIDVLVLRRDLHQIHNALPGWEIYACQYPGKDVLHFWPKGEPVPDEVHDMWCRPAAGEPWGLQLMVVNDDGERMAFRRDPRLTWPLAEVTGHAAGHRILNPAIQLLYKSRNPRPKDIRDFERALPHLSNDHRTILVDALTRIDPANPWLEQLTALPTPHR